MRNRFDKLGLVLILTIIATMIIPQITYADQALSQSDVNIPSDWAIIQIDEAEEIDLVPEKILGEYRSSITREEFCELAVKLYEILSEEDILPVGNPFTDTQNTEVIVANNLGIVNGIGDGKFAPNKMVAREEVSVMVYRTLKAAKPEYDYSGLYKYIFSDHNMISAWAQDAVAYLYGVGIINGIGNNQFNPGGQTSREEAIVLVKRMYDKVIDSQEASRNSLIVSRGSTREHESVVKLKSLIPQELGKPYQWGKTGPGSYDCSGLVYSLFGKLGITLPRTSKDQSTVGTYVAKEDLMYGDMVFFARDGIKVNHSGIYVGNGEFVHSPGEGDVVKIESLMSGYNADKYYTARRVLP